MAADNFDALVLDGLTKSYSIEELRRLCLRLGVDHESLAQPNRDVLARELIDHMRHHGRLNDLIAQLRLERPHVPWPDPPPEPARRPPVPRQLPTPATHFTGRGPELAQLTAALQPGHIVTLYGPGGIGKTALTAEALHALFPLPAAGDRSEGAARFPDGVLFHSFYGHPAAADCAAHVARSCGIDPNPDPFAALAAALHNRVALLVLDGAEEADDLDALLERRGGGGVLITSRRRADVREIGIEIERLPPDDALALLRSLAGDLAAGDEAATAICELVGNLPLALRLAGAFMFRERQSAAEYRDWLAASGLAALDFGLRRRDSVPVLLARSVAQVSEAAGAALAVAGCLALQPFDVAPVAAALALDDPAARRALGELVNYELLRRPAVRYETTHALVYGYARERQPPAADGLRRLGEYYAALAEAESAKGLPGYRRLEGERGHILALLPRLAAAGEWATANRLVRAVEGWLDIQGYPRDRIAALEVGLAAARALGDRRGEGAHLTHLGNAYHALGQVERAIALYEQALAVAREIGDRRGEGNRLYNLGLALEQLGRNPEAIASFERALAAYESIDAPNDADDARRQLARLRGAAA